MGKRLVLVPAVVAAVLLVPAAAYAHVSVNPSTASHGSFTKLSFRVPNETEDANTTQVEVDIPTDKPIASVSVQPLPGWEVKVDKTTLDTPVESDDGPVTEAVSKVTWSGGTIAPGEFQEFNISAGPLPEADEIVFKALQTYDNGDVVRWIDEPLPDGSEPEHPAPVLALTESTGDEHSATETTVAEDDHSDDAETTGTAAEAEEDDDSNGLAIVALVVGGVALIVGIGALMMARKRPA